MIELEIQKNFIFLWNSKIVVNRIIENLFNGGSRLACNMDHYGIVIEHKIAFKII